MLRNLCSACLVVAFSLNGWVYAAAPTTDKYVNKPYRILWVVPSVITPKAKKIVPPPEIYDCDDGEYYDYQYENDLYCYTYSVASESYIRTEKSTGVKILSYADSVRGVEIYDASTSIPDGDHLSWISGENGIIPYAVVNDGENHYCWPNYDCFGEGSGDCWMEAYTGAGFYTEQECDTFLRSFLPEAIQNYQFPGYCNTYWSHVDGEGVTQACSQ